MSGEVHKAPQTPGEAIAEQMAFIEQGLRELDAYLERHAAFDLYLAEHDRVEGEQ